MPKPAVAYWEQALGKMVKEAGWKQILDQNSWIDLFQTGDKFQGMLTKELADYEKILKDLGMVK
jgi:tripartite-type tricarboxylate transporter receptor subunit TctC